jgi:hypothetical protein
MNGSILRTGAGGFGSPKVATRGNANECPKFRLEVSEYLAPVRFVWSSSKQELPCNRYSRLYRDCAPISTLRGAATSPQLLMVTGHIKDIATDANDPDRTLDAAIARHWLEVERSDLS